MEDETATGTSETDRFIEEMIESFAKKMSDYGFSIFVVVGNRDNTYYTFTGNSSDMAEFAKVAFDMQLVVKIREQIDGE